MFTIEPKKLYCSDGFWFYVKEINDDIAIIVACGKVWNVQVGYLASLDPIEEKELSKENLLNIRECLTETTQACSIATPVDYFMGVTPVYCLYKNKLWYPKDREGVKILKDKLSEEEVVVGFVFGGKIYEESEVVVKGFSSKDKLFYLKDDILEEPVLVGEQFFDKDEKPIRITPVIHEGDKVTFDEEVYLVKEVAKGYISLDKEGEEKVVTKDFDDIKLVEDEELYEEGTPKTQNAYKEKTHVWTFYDGIWVHPEEEDENFVVGDKGITHTFSSGDPVIYKGDEYTVVKRKQDGYVELKSSSGRKEIALLNDLETISNPVVNEELEVVVPAASVTDTILTEELPDTKVKPIEDYQKPIDDGKSQNLPIKEELKKKIIYRDTDEISDAFILEGSVFKKYDDSVVKDNSEGEFYYYRQGDFVKFNDLVYRIMNIDVTNGLFKLKDYYKWLYQGDNEYVDASPLNCEPLTQAELNTLVTKTLKVAKRFDEDFEEDKATKALQDKEPKESLKEEDCVIEVSKSILEAVLGEDKVSLMEESVEGSPKYIFSKAKLDCMTAVEASGGFYAVVGDSE